MKCQLCQTNTDYDIYDLPCIECCDLMLKLIELGFDKYEIINCIELGKLKWPLKQAPKNTLTDIIK